MISNYFSLFTRAWLLLVNGVESGLLHHGHCKTLKRNSIIFQQSVPDYGLHWSTQVFTWATKLSATVSVIHVSKCSLHCCLSLIHPTQLEKMMKLFDCRSNVPYLNLAKISGDFQTHFLWSGKVLGGQGNANIHNCVTSGPFVIQHWRLTPEGHSSCGLSGVSKCCLQRSMKLRGTRIPVADGSRIEALINIPPPQYPEFLAGLEVSDSWRAALWLVLYLVHREEEVHSCVSLKGIAMHGVSSLCWKVVKYWYFTFHRVYSLWPTTSSSCRNGHGLQRAWMLVIMWLSGRVGFYLHIFLCSWMCL